MSMTVEAAKELDSKDDVALDAALSEKKLDFFKDAKGVLPEVVAERFYKMFKKRWTTAEEYARAVEKRMSDMTFEDQSVGEDRFEILAELLDKIFQALEIYDEHEDRKIPFSHRLVLESRLLTSMHDGLDLITNTFDNFDKIGENKDESNYERQELRFEIRYRDMVYTEIHERYLKSYLDMEW